MTASGDTQGALDAFRAGGFAIVVDDPGRENEGDLCVAAAAVTAEQINFLMREARGLICVALPGRRLDQLRLPPVVARNTSPYATGFAVSVDAAGPPVTTGVSAADRALTIRRLADPSCGPDDFVRPGHVFPLRGRPRGLLERTGHTEAALELASRTGQTPAAVLCEIVSEDGSMARREELERFGRLHQIPLVTIAELVTWRRQAQRLVKRDAETVIPTVSGRWRTIAFRDLATGSVHLALVLGDPRADQPVLVRVHSECLTGEVFGSLRCDCREQLQEAMARISEEGSGVVVYLRQEGRGIGLMNKLHAYALQDRGLDTVEANRELGFPPDRRDYGVAAEILAELGLRRLRILSNNPRKSSQLRSHGLVVEQRVPLEIAPNPDNARYLETKRDKLGHLLSRGAGKRPGAGEP